MDRIKYIGFDMDYTLVGEMCTVFQIILQHSYVHIKVGVVAPLNTRVPSLAYFWSLTKIHLPPTVVDILMYTTLCLQTLVPNSVLARVYS